MATKVSRSAVILHPVEKVYDLVADVKSYPKFLPWCQDAFVLSSEEVSSEGGSSEEVSSEVDIVEALLIIVKGGLRCEFATRNLMKRNQSIEIQLLRGPFSHLQGTWLFKPLENLEDDACSIFLELDFELSNPVLKAAFGSVFRQAVNKMVGAFCLRADQLYGSGNE